MRSEGTGGLLFERHSARDPALPSVQHYYFRWATNLCLVSSRNSPPVVPLTLSCHELQTLIVVLPVLAFNVYALLEVY